MAITIESVNTALGPLREGFQADGADLAVDEASESLVRVRLVVTPKTCMECIVPSDILTAIVENVIRESFPDAGRFVFVDSRPVEATH